MKIWDVQQNSEQWMQLRSAIPTASEMHRVVCSEMRSQYTCADCGQVQERKRKTCAGCAGKSIQESRIVKPSTSQDGYLYQLLACSFGITKQRPPNGHMDRGHELEPKALAAYELISGQDVTVAGFCTTDDGMIGCSPDGLVGEDGLVEAKCPGAEIHLRHLIERDLTADHKVQAQAQMLVTGRQWCDVVSHCEDFPPECHLPRTIILRAERDEGFISGANAILVDFIVRYQTVRAELISKYGAFVRNAAFGEMGVSDADVDQILQQRKTDDNT